MKKLMIALIIAVSCYGMDELPIDSSNVKIIEHNEYYRLFCIKGCLFVKDSRYGSTFTQIMEPGVSSLLPMRCK